jgi:hypothetical protein
MKQFKLLSENYNIKIVNENTVEYYHPVPYEQIKIFDELFPMYERNEQKLGEIIIIQGGKFVHSIIPADNGFILTTQYFFDLEAI